MMKCRVPVAQKPIHKIGEAICTEVPRLKYNKFAYDNTFALSDGFKDSAELREWFGDPSVYGDTKYDVIKWDKVIR